MNAYASTCVSLWNSCSERAKLCPKSSCNVHVSICPAGALYDHTAAVCTCTCICNYIFKFEAQCCLCQLGVVGMDTIGGMNIDCRQCSRYSYLGPWCEHTG